MKLSTNIGKNSDIVVLGKYEVDGISYNKVAKNLNATYYSNPWWDEINEVYKKYGKEDDMWKINEAFLKNQTDAGKTIIFSHNPWDSK